MDIEKSTPRRKGVDLNAVVERLTWTPKRLRWNPEANNQLTWGLTFLYALVSDDVW
jgi:hypothetical protein